MKKLFPVYAAVLAALFTFYLFLSFADKNQLPSPAKYFLSQVVKPIDLNRSFDFAGEEVPMDNPDVQQRLDRELLSNAYTHAVTLINIKRANAVFPLIEPVLASQGLPDDFKYLAVAESNLSNVAVSSANAKGVWQFMKGTAVELGLEVNEEVDERLNLEKSTLAACQFLKELKNKLGSWTNAAAAYNMGGSGLSRDASAQKQNDYYNINLNSETLRYVFRIVAIKDIMSRPEAYGYYLERNQLYQPLNNYYIKEVSDSVPSWVDFAIQNNTNLRMLKFYNPWIVGNSLTNKSKKIYQVKIPNQG